MRAGKSAASWANPSGAIKRRYADVRDRAQGGALTLGNVSPSLGTGFARKKGAVMSNRLSLFALAAALGIGAQATPSQAQPSARAAFEDLRNGGYVVVIRHGRTNESPSNPKEESPTDLANCAG
jgi:hypothetical protein